MLVNISKSTFHIDLHYDNELRTIVFTIIPQFCITTPLEHSSDGDATPLPWREAVSQSYRSSIYDDITAWFFSPVNDSVYYQIKNCQQYSLRYFPRFGFYYSTATFINSFLIGDATPLPWRIDQYLTTTFITLKN